MANYIVTIIGRPNVGKSTLFNRVIGKSKSIHSRIPGTTRDTIHESTEWNDVEFTLIDTAGMGDFAKEENLKSEITKQVDQAISNADLIIFMMDAKTGLQPLDQEIVEKLRKRQERQPVIPVINKIDAKMAEGNKQEFTKLGLDHQPTYISAITGKNVSSLLDSIAEKLNQLPQPQEPETEPDIDLVARISLLGRPNVGKSTLFNRLVGENRSIVSKTPGTTRDTIDETVEFNDKHYQFVDTAGLRRKAKVDDTLERFSVIRTIRSTQRSDIGIVLIDAEEGATAQDKKIISIVLKERRGLILAVNKWDLIEKQRSQSYQSKISHDLDFVDWSPLLFISAETGYKINDVYKAIDVVSRSRSNEIPDPELNDFLNRIVHQNPPAQTDNEIYNATQVQTKPPTFEIRTEKRLEENYFRYIENQLREKYDFVGTPISLYTKQEK